MKTIAFPLPLILCLFFLSTASAADREPGKDTLDRALKAVALGRTDLRIRPDLYSNPFVLDRFNRWMQNPLGAPLEAQEKALQLLAASPDPVYWFARLAECGDVPNAAPFPATRTPEDPIPGDVPVQLRMAFLLLLAAMDAADRKLTAMQDEIPPDSRERIADFLYPDLFSGNGTRDKREEGSRTGRVREALRLAGTVDRKAMADSALTLLGALARAADLLSGPGMKGVDVPSFSFNTRVGLVKVGGRGPDTHEEGAALIIDLGGDDLYRGKIASGRDGRCSLVLDLEGNDTYLGEDFTQAAGHWGIGILLDRKGSDLYKAGNASQGAGLFGIGILIDEEGNDRYLGGEFSQAASSWGWGGLIDLSGEDLYQCESAGQAFSGVLGVSCLCDLEGNDRYLSGLNSPDPREPDMNQSLSQGFSIGMRNLAAGGFAILADRAGNDFYQCQYFGQGSSYWMGIGVLYDHEGNDSYLARRYAQGAGIHFSLGMLLDAGGNDHTGSWGVSQGCGHDYGIGILINQGGNDTYVSDWLSMGASEANGIGLFVDSGGDDGYDSARSGMGEGHLTAPRRAGGIGIFMDVGGRDRYAGRGDDNSLWAPNRFGVGIDDPEGRLSGFGISPSETSGPAAGWMERKKAHERARLPKSLAWEQERPRPADLEALLSAASHWGLDMEIAEKAKERLLAMDPRVSVPAMARLLGTPNIMSLLFLEKFFTIHPFHALPHLMEKTKDEDPTVQAVALFMLGQIRDTRAMDGVLSALTNPSWRVRAAAVRAAGEMLERERLARLVPIRGFLRQILERGEPGDLKEFLSKDTLAALLSILVRSWPIDYDVYRPLADLPLQSEAEGIDDERLALITRHAGDMLPLTERWIKDIERSGDFGPKIMERMDDPDPAVRRAAAYALGQMRFGPSLERLMALLRDPDRWVRDAAVLSLALFRDEAIPHLGRALEGKDPGLTILAVDALAGMKSEASEALIRTLLDYPDENVRRAAARALPPP
ncbi:MAG: HEAT repeat domain-containing protein [Thermodesulfobacteriota bacterium]